MTPAALEQFMEATVNTQVSPATEIIVTGRNVDVSAHYRMYVAGKLARLGRYSSHVVHYDVVLDHERNPRQSKVCQRVEITGRGKGSDGAGRGVRT
jgi:ribosomal subunit interface protein